jgi:hypothetical protein
MISSLTVFRTLLIGKGTADVLVSDVFFCQSYAGHKFAPDKDNIIPDHL